MNHPIATMEPPSFTLETEQNNMHPGVNAFIAHANFFQFKESGAIFHPQVFSRTFIWAKEGKGIIKVNGKKYEMLPDHFLYAPWKHRITYKADARNPFLVGCIHIIPSHSHDYPLQYRVAHRPSQYQPGEDHIRRDENIPALNGTPYGILHNHPPLLSLANYIVKRFYTETLPTEESRKLASLFIPELIRHVLSPDQTTAHYPEELKRMMQFIDLSSHEPLSLHDLVDYSKLSPSGVGRMFVKHLKVTPVQWITQQKLKVAKHLLATTHLQVSEIGKKVGWDDPYYFSKLFKKNVGHTPLGYRKKISVL